MVSGKGQTQIKHIIRDNAEIIEENFNSGTEAYGKRASY
jgi:hypothetical protein